MWIATLSLNLRRSYSEQVVWKLYQERLTVDYLPKKGSENHGTSLTVLKRAQRYFIYFVYGLTANDKFHRQKIITPYC